MADIKISVLHLSAPCLILCSQIWSLDLAGPELLSQSTKILFQIYDLQTQNPYEPTSNLKYNLILLRLEFAVSSQQNDHTAVFDSLSTLTTVLLERDGTLAATVLLFVQWYIQYRFYICLSIQTCSILSCSNAGKINCFSFKRFHRAKIVLICTLLCFCMLKCTL